MKKEASKKKEMIEKHENARSKMVAELEAIKSLDKKSISREIAEKKEILREVREFNMKLKEKNNLKSLLDEKKKRYDDIVEQQDGIKDDIGSINASKMKLSKEIADLKDSEKDHDILRKRISDNLEKEKELAVKKAYLTNEIESIDKKVTELNQELAEMDKIKGKLRKLGQMHNWLDNYFIMLMAVMEKQVMLTVYNEFNSLFQKWFELLVEDETMQARLDEQFTPIIIQNGYDAPISNLSGGKRTAAALAYRLALNRVVNDLMARIMTKDILILDEPTDGFSYDQLDRVRDLLDDLGIIQTLNVSYESKIESFVDHVIRINKDEGSSQLPG